MPIILSKKAGGGGGSGAPSGPAGGDLGGTYPNPEVDVVDDDILGSGSPSATTVLTGDRAWTNIALLAAGLSGWVDDTAATWTRTANTTFTVTGDRTSVFTKGTRLRWTQTTVKYGTVVASSHAAGTTTVTIAATPDYVLTAAAISLNSYSYAASPQGYPTWFSFVPTFTGFSVDPTGFTCHFSIVGSSLFFNYASGTAGTSNATTFTMTVPVAILGSIQIVCRVQNNGTPPNTPGLAVLNTGAATVLSLFLNTAAAAFTNVNAKDAWVQFYYNF